MTPEDVESIVGALNLIAANSGLFLIAWAIRWLVEEMRREK